MTLDEIGKLIEAATPGPWEIIGSGDSAWLKDVQFGYEGEMMEGDARFIAASRTLLPALLEHAIAMRDELEGAHAGDPYICSAEAGAKFDAWLEAIKLP